MNLLIVTQKVDREDGILGFFHDWIIELAKHFETVTVVCLYKGVYNLPKNVAVYSLGKETGVSRLKYVQRFYSYIWSERATYDAVFVHMNPEYIVLGGLLWKLWKKKVVLWYTHRHVDMKLRIAEKFSDLVFTSAKESFNIHSDKVRVVGHGIDVTRFKKPDDWTKHETYTLVSVGRITPIKNLDTLIEAARLLRAWYPTDRFHVLIVGAPVTAGDREYFKKLQREVRDAKLESVVTFVGGVPYEDIKRYYWDSDVSVNLCPTGGIDKAVLESMAAGLPVLVSNIALAAYFGERAEELLFAERDARELAEKIVHLRNSKMAQKIGADLERAVASSSVSALISHIAHDIKNIY